MLQKEWSILIVIAACGILAATAALTTLVGWSIAPFILAAAMLFLATSQFLMFGLFPSHNAILSDQIDLMKRAQQKATSDHRALSQRVQALEGPQAQARDALDFGPNVGAATPTPRTRGHYMPAHNAVGGASEFNYKSVVGATSEPAYKRSSGPSAAPTTAPLGRQQQQPSILSSAPPESYKNSAGPANDSFDLMLEPIIALNSDETVHYATRLEMIDERGGTLNHETLMARATQAGMRIQLDLVLLRYALPVLRRLQLKHDYMRFFIPLGAVTLKDPAGLDQVLAALTEASDISGHIVFEISQDTLANLSPEGISGLARLSRQGNYMALIGVASGNLDLRSLHKLGFRFIGLKPSARLNADPKNPNWIALSRSVDAGQFQLLAYDIKNSAESAEVRNFAQLARGPFFAPPRRVKPGVGMNARIEHQSAA